MREVEVKFRVSDVDRVADVLELVGLALGPAVCQDDQAYAPATWSYGESKTGVSFVRLRSIGERHVFTLKQPRENELSCLEHETAIDDREAMHAAIAAMGFRPTVRIVKTRRVATDGTITVCLDEVDGLGAFLEIERLVGSDTPIDGVQEELAAFVDGLGLEVERVDQTYDSLLHMQLSTACR